MASSNRDLALKDIKAIVQMARTGMTNRQIVQSYDGCRFKLTSEDIDSFIRMFERGLLETKMKKQISVDRLREIVAEEVGRLHEDVDHEGAAAVASSASKLLKALGEFQEKATETANAAVQRAMPGLRDVLENMVNAPGSYVDAPKKVPQKVSFKPGGSSGLE